MDWLSFAAAVIESLAWPITVVTLALVLRKPIARLLPELRHLRYGDLQIEFGRKLEEIESAADEANVPQSVEGPGPFPAIDIPRTFQEYVARIAATSPRAAVVEAWRFVEGALQMVAEEKHLPAPYSAKAVEQFLREKGALPETTASLLRELRMLRNKAAHAGEFAITFEQAREYGVLAVRLSAAVMSAGQSIQG